MSNSPTVDAERTKLSGSGKCGKELDLNLT